MGESRQGAFQILLLAAGICLGQLVGGQIMDGVVPQLCRNTGPVSILKRGQGEALLSPKSGFQKGKNGICCRVDSVLIHKKLP